MKKLLLLLSFACSFGSAFAYPAPDTVGCVGSNTDLSWAMPPIFSIYSTGHYTSSDISVATVDSFSGIVHALSPGITNIEYWSIGVAHPGLTFHVYPTLGPSITGDDVMCAGTAIPLTIATIGGTWSSSQPGVATVNTSSGLVSGMARGIANIIYFSSGACASHSVRVVGNHSDSFLSVAPFVALCAGSVTTLATQPSIVPGGTWTSSDPAIATVAAIPGSYPHSIVTGVSAGTVNISYTLTSAPVAAGCADTEIHYRTLTVDTIVSVVPITGRHFVCINNIDSLMSSVEPGSWSSADPGIASIAVDWGALAMVRGVAAGSTTITCTFPASTCTASGYTTFEITVPSADSTNTVHITGPASICAGSYVTFTATPSGGSWYLESSSGLSGTIDPAGTVSGLYPGMVGEVGYYVYNPTCGTIEGAIPIAVFESPDAGTITGPSASCFGIADTFHVSATGGIWTISPSATASITGGVVTTSSPGNYSVLYSVTSGCGTATDTVSLSVVARPAVSPIYASSSTMCMGSTITLSDTLGGGIWHSSDPSVIAVGGTTYWSAVASPLSPGTTNISYIYSGMCAGTPVADTVTATYTTVSLPDAGVVSGPTSACLGDPLAYNSTTSGGVWSATGPFLIDAATGVAACFVSGSGNIQYVATNACGVDSAMLPTTVHDVLPLGGISGPVTVMAGHTISLANATAGGAWSVSSLAVATIDAVSGVLTGVGVGSVMVTYTPSGCYSPSYATYSVAVVPADEISGSVYFAPTSYTGNIRVWLIAYNAPMLTAIDSIDVYSAGSNAAYQFLNEPAGTYRIKAAPLDGPLTGTGFIPTYYISSLYWNTADVITHATASVNAGVNINLMTGTVTTGPGFIGGDVTTGANKGTTDGAPVNNLMMYLLDATNTLYQSTRTDATGHYSFSNIPPGTYYVFPDSMNYATIPYTGINITSGSLSVTNARFIQHTLSHIISPIPVGVSNVAATNASVIMFPNPTSGKVNIAWQVAAAQKAKLTITDITGRVVSSEALNMSAGAGSSTIDMSDLVSGLYTISVKSDDVNYISKIQVQH